jgi:DNA-binding SARP family transcriptional activator/tetratricopeptide (TPR) repeat protein
LSGVATTDFLLLGPVEIRAGGRPVGPPQPRQLHVLAALLVDVNRPVTWATLIDRVWGHEPPEGARTAMRAHVSRIRQALTTASEVTGRPAQLVRGGGGYELRLDADRVDLHRLRRLARQARTAATDATERVRLLREAVGLWRGEPLAGLPGEWADRTRTAWQQERLEVAAAWAAAEIEVGNAPAVVGPLTDLVGEHPLVESLAAVHLRALRATGRTAEAVEQYARIRDRLADELGVHPGVELRRAHQAVLRGDRDEPTVPAPSRATDPPAAVPAQLPVDVRGFVGRAAHLDRLDGLLENAAAQPTAAVIALICGTAGVGKTTLAVHWAHRVVDRFADGQLYVNLRGFGPVGQPMDPAEAIRRCLGALDIPARRIPAELDAQAALYRSELAGRRMLVLLDNARDAAQVRPLLPGAPQCLVLVTSRNRLTSLVAAEGAHSVDLDLLGVDEAVRLLDRRLGTERVASDPRAVRVIVDRCVRLPLALALAAAHAATRPRLPLAAVAGELSHARDKLDALADEDPRTDLRAVFFWSYHTLTAPAGRLFRLLGLHPGQDISAASAASLAALNPRLAKTLLTELTRVNLLTEHAPGRYNCHDLLRAYAAELAATSDADSEREQAVGRVLDHYLRTAYTADRLLYPARDPVPLAAPRAGVLPESLADDRQALDWFTAEHATLLAAVEHAAATGFDTHAWQLAWTLRTFLVRQGHWHDLASAYRLAVSAAERLSNQAVLAATHHTLGSAYTRLGRFDEAHDELRTALDLYRGVGDRVGQAKTHHHLSYLCERQDDTERSLDHARLALDLYRAAGHRNGQAQALNGVGWYHSQLGNHRQALSCCRQALDLFRELGDRQGQANTWDSLGYAHHNLGDHLEATACYRQALALFRALGNRYNEADTLTHLGDTHEAAGDLDAARNVWHPALAILDELRHPDTAKVRARIERLGTVRSTVR